MSDIPDSGSFNLGLASIASQNYGPNAVANQAQTAASTALTQQQTQGAAIQNANARLQYQLFRQGMAHLTDFSGQSGPTLGAGVNDSSGVTAASASPPGVPVAVTPEDDIGQSAAKQAYIEASLEHQYNVDPAGTAAEQQAIIAAHQYAVQMKLSGNKGLADAAEEKVAMLKEQRDMNVTSRKNSAAVEANSHYDKFAAVESAPDGKAFDTLTAVAPNSAEMIQKQNPDATPEELDEIARDTTSHVAAFMHRFTDRPTKVGDDGVTYDEKTGMRVDVPIRGVSAERQASLLEQANKIVTTKNSDGTETTEPQYQRDGYKNPNAWVSDAVAQIRSRNAASNVVEAVGNHAAQYGHVTPGAPPVPGGTLYRGPQPGQPQPGAQPGGVPQPGAPGAAGQQPGQQPQRPDNGLLPGVNPDALPKIQMPTVRPGTSQSPADAETAKGVAASRIEQMKASNDAYTNDQKEGALLKAAQREAAALANNPRMAGPGSEVAQALAKIRTAVTGQAPDSLVDLGGLDKILLQLGAQNVRAALQGQKITQAEFLLMLGKGNPNTEQPLQTVNKLLGYLGAQNDYDQRFNRTKMTALQRGANPLTIDSEIGARADRGDYVEGKVGVRPPLAGGQSGGGQSSSTTAATEGATSTSKSGKPIVFTNGHWQYKQ
jgi:hypothetical protein